MEGVFRAWEGEGEGEARWVLNGAWGVDDDDDDGDSDDLVEGETEDDVQGKESVTLSEHGDGVDRFVTPFSGVYDSEDDDGDDEESETLTDSDSDSDPETESDEEDPIPIARDTCDTLDLDQFASYIDRCRKVEEIEAGRVRMFGPFL